MNSPHPRPASRAFTLIELLVVMVIVAILAAGVVAGISAVRRKGDATAASKNLRQLASAVQQFSLENRRYPEAIDNDASNGGGAWSWQIREFIGFTTDGNEVPENWPSELVLSPRHGNAGVAALDAEARRNLHHFAASLVVMPEVSGGGTSTAGIVRPTDVTDPSATILLGDAPLKTENDPASGCEHAWLGLGPEVAKGNPDEALDEGILKKEVDFWMNGQAQFLFADGHVESLKPEMVKRRYFQLDPLEEGGAP